MYQVNLSANKKYSFWIRFLTDRLKNNFTDLSGVVTDFVYGSRVSVCLAVKPEFKNIAKQIISDAIAELFSCVEKRRFFLNALNMRFCDSLSRDMLINALIAFNSDAERNFIKRSVKLKSEFNLDGFFNFRLKDIQDEWAESAALIYDNAELVRDEDSFNVIMKFLLSGIDAEIKTVVITKNEHFYILSDRDMVNCMRFFTGDQMLLKLAELAPEKVLVDSKVTDCRVRKKICELFYTNV